MWSRDSESTREGARVGFSPIHLTHLELYNRALRVDLSDEHELGGRRGVQHALLLEGLAEVGLL